MVRSRLPVPSLLGLFGAVLMLCPELLEGNTKGLSDLPATDPGVQNALAFAVEQYNKDKFEDSNYYRIQRVVKVQSQVTHRDKYCLKVAMVRTDCQKISRKSYHEIQSCRGLLGNINKQTCFFKIMLDFLTNKMNLAVSACTMSLTPPSYDVFCTG